MVDHIVQANFHLRSMTRVLPVTPVPFILRFGGMHMSATGEKKSWLQTLAFAVS